MSTRSLNSNFENSICRFHVQNMQRSRIACSYLIEPKVRQRGDCNVN